MSEHRDENFIWRKDNGKDGSKVSRTLTKRPIQRHTDNGQKFRVQFFPAQPVRCDLFCLIKLPRLFGFHIDFRISGESNNANGGGNSRKSNKTIVFYSLLRQ